MPPWPATTRTTSAVRSMCLSCIDACFGPVRGDPPECCCCSLPRERSQARTPPPNCLISPGEMVAGAFFFKGQQKRERRGKKYRVVTGTEMQSDAAGASGKCLLHGEDAGVVGGRGTCARRRQVDGPFQGRMMWVERKTTSHSTRETTASCVVCSMWL